MQHIINTIFDGVNKMDDIITLAYGSGGRKTSQLIEEILLPAFNNNELSKLGDGAILNGSNKLVFSTDSFVVNPYFFKGGDIGKLSVCGTVNDVAMCGGIPKFLSLGLIIEEGFKTEHLVKIVNSIKETAEKCGVIIVTGDTKVVERGKGDGIYINTSGIGYLACDSYGSDKIQEGDLVIVTGSVGDHGVSVMLSRDNLLGENNILSDCTPLNMLAEELFKYKDEVRILRDPTRGGVATTLNEFVEDSEFCIELEEKDIPVKSSVNNACEILGLDPLYCANEGKMLAIVSPDKADEILNDLRKHEEGKEAVVIGKITKKHPGKVIVKTLLGGTRIMSKLTGAQLPRIC